jgi:hypothetical protein
VVICGTVQIMPTKTVNKEINYGKPKNSNNLGREC